MSKLTVIDFFCGAGGFSEGFRQRGFDIVQGVDSWRPAIDTFNHNFGLSCKPEDIRVYGGDVGVIETLPDTDIIIGSPPCVSFSSSNKCGKADKTLGINLIEVFLRIVAVKMHKPKSHLKAWFMENVTNSAKYTNSVYTFSDLKLDDWAKAIGKNANDIAIKFSANHLTINSADFGVAQVRKRLFAGEVISKASLPSILSAVQPTHHETLAEIFKDFPSPFDTKSDIGDPNYIGLSLPASEVTDHSYDAGVYEALWQGSKYLKTNHPYMGKMAFPENVMNPSRTITSTKIVNSREALIYLDELGRTGDGQYRTPTIREIAILMSFPMTYQFVGSENTKWKLIGNAVCPKVSSAIANELLACLGCRRKNKIRLQRSVNLDGITDLNKLEKNCFLTPPMLKENARFRRHPFKAGNMTVALSNYCLVENGLSDGKWRTTVTYGTGEGFKLQEINPSKTKQQLHDIVYANFEDAVGFFGEVHNGFSEKIADGKTMQTLYEKNASNDYLNPVKLVEEAAQLISKYANGEVVSVDDVFEHKNNVPKRQLYALYVISHISSIANGD